jgi:hypothetical protein
MDVTERISKDKAWTNVRLEYLITNKGRLRKIQMKWRRRVF